MSENWSHYAGVTVKHSCDGVRGWLEAQGVTGSALDFPVAVSQETFAPTEQKRINAVALIARMQFKEIGCTCVSDFVCDIVNTSEDV